MCSFGEKLKAIRLHRNMSQDDLAKLVGTTKQTISRYETGINSPRLDSIAVISKKLNIDMSLLINRKYSINDVLYPDTNNSGTPSNLNNAGSSSELLKSPIILNTANHMSHLNTRGKTLVANYARDLVNSGSYSNSDLTVNDCELYSIASAAAGTGSYNDNSQNKFHILKTENIVKHDAMIDVCGNSMQPTISDGDVAFISYSFNKKDGEIYVVQIDDDTVIKRCYFENDSLKLVSDNPDYNDRIISGTALETVRIIGRVIAWSTPVI